MTVEVSNSEFKTFMECRRKWYITYYLRLRLRAKSFTGPLPLGSRVHAALEEFYKNGADLLAAHDALVQKDLQSAMEAGDPTGDLEDEADLGHLMLEGYLAWLDEEGYDDDSYEIIGSEEILKMPMLDGALTLMGKTDLRVFDKRQGIALVRDFKAQPLDEMVLTPGGWRTMGSIEPGDTVMGSGWQPIDVLETFDSGQRDVYRITFTDGTSVRASDDHLWPVSFGLSGNPVEIVETSKLKERLDGSITSGRGRDKSPRYNYGAYIQSVDPDRGEPRRGALPLDPYTLGAWISDGRRQQAEITDAAAETDRFAAIGGTVRPGRDGVSISTIGPSANGALRELGLLERYSHERFIPPQYLSATYDDRLSLMHGLMDGDGTMTGTSTCTYITSSRQLADDVALLAVSLGWASRVWTHNDPKYTYNGEERTGRTSYRVVLVSDVCPFRHSARNTGKWHEVNDRVRTRSRVRSKRIRMIEHVGTEHCKCLNVDALDNLYVTAGGVLTHNTVASFSSYTDWSHLNPQVKTYQLLDYVNKPEDKRIAGAEFHLLKKVKRGPRAKPPFYERHEIRHNVFVLRAFWKQLHGVARDLLAVREALDNGADHREVAYPHASRDCTWSCPAYHICPLFDDGSDVRGMLEADFEEVDPYDYYN